MSKINTKELIKKQVKVLWGSSTSTMEKKGMLRRLFEQLNKEDELVNQEINSYIQKLELILKKENDFIITEDIMLTDLIDYYKNFITGEYYERKIYF
jgi:hypothetical protein